MSIKEKTKIKLRNLIDDLIDNPDINASYFVDYWNENDEDPFQWKVVVNGPVGSPYEGGYFKLKVEFPDDFPTSAPTVKFITKIYHCNVLESTGKICLNKLTSWKPDYKMKDIFEDIYYMLDNQNPDSAYLNEEGINKGTEYKNNREEFNRKARKYVDSYARLSQL